MSFKVITQPWEWPITVEQRGWFSTMAGTPVWAQLAQVKCPPDADAVLAMLGGSRRFSKSSKPQVGTWVLDSPR